MIPIRTEDLSFSWGTTKILDRISMSASAGQFVGIIGPNGSGKSTLLKCIYRVLHPQGGCIWVDSCAQQKLSYKETARLMGVVSQHTIYDFDFTVKDVVMMGRTPHKKMLERDSPEDYAIVHRALKQVDMYEMINRPFSSLSGGEQQRVVLARVLAQETKALILDEPTNHLDIKYQLQLLNTVKKQDCTVIFAIHDLNLAALYCDYIYVLKEGRIVGEGTPHEILTTELILSVYGIKAEIYVAEDGISHILYKP